MNRSQVIDESIKIFKKVNYGHFKTTQEFNILKIGPFEVLYSSKECIISWGKTTLTKCPPQEVPMQLLIQYNRLATLELEDWQDAIDFLPIRDGHLHNYFHFETVVEYIRDLYGLKDEQYTKVHLAFDIARFGKQTRVRSRRFSRYNDVFVPESITDYRGHYAGYVDVFIPQANVKRPQNVEIGAADVFLLLFMKFAPDMKLLMEMAENLPLVVRDELLQTGLTEYTELFENGKMSDGKYKLTIHAFEPYEIAEMSEILSESIRYVEDMKREYRKSLESEEEEKLERKARFKEAKETLEKRKEELKKKKKTKKRKNESSERIDSIKILKTLQHLTPEQLDEIEPTILKSYAYVRQSDFEALRERKQKQA